MKTNTRLTACALALMATAWHPHAVRDRELITGQNPFSDATTMELVQAAMEARR